MPRRKIIAIAGLLLLWTATALGAGYVLRIMQEVSDTAILRPLDAILSSKVEAVDAQFPSYLFSDVLDSINSEYLKKTADSKTLFYGALTGMVGALGDPYSSFFPPKDAAQFDEQVEGQFEGIGAEIGFNDEKQLTVIAPLPGTPAEKAGLKTADRILAIDSQETTNMNVDEAVQKIRGKKGTTVTITILHEGAKAVEDITITRDAIKVPSMEWKMDGDFAYIRIYSFSGNVVSDFNRIKKEVVDKKPKGILLDLRGNPGGYLDAAVDISGNFLTSGTTVVIESFGTGKEQVYRSSGSAMFADVPVVVLVNKGSASASEILAGALQDNNKAIVVGEKSFGKGTVQSYRKLQDGSSLKITVAKWLTPKGTEINGVGIVPGVEVAQDVSTEKDEVLEKAKQVLAEYKR